jgi:hypothetical protein
MENLSLFNYNNFTYTKFLEENSSFIYFRKKNMQYLTYNNVQQNFTFNTI